MNRPHNWRDLPEDIRRRLVLEFDPLNRSEIHWEEIEGAIAYHYTQLSDHQLRTWANEEITAHHLAIGNLNAFLTS